MFYLLPWPSWLWYLCNRLHYLCSLTRREATLSRLPNGLEWPQQGSMQSQCQEAELHPGLFTPGDVLPGAYGPHLARAQLVSCSRLFWRISLVPCSVCSENSAIGNLYATILVFQKAQEIPVTEVKGSGIFSPCCGRDKKQTPLVLTIAMY